MKKYYQWFGETDEIGHINILTHRVDKLEKILESLLEYLGLTKEEVSVVIKKKK